MCVRTLPTLPPSNPFTGTCSQYAPAYAPYPHTLSPLRHASTAPAGDVASIEWSPPPCQLVIILSPPADLTLMT